MGWVLAKGRRAHSLPSWVPFPPWARPTSLTVQTQAHLWRVYLVPAMTFWVWMHFSPPHPSPTKKLLKTKDWSLATFKALHLSIFPAEQKPWSERTCWPSRTKTNLAGSSFLELNVWFYVQGLLQPQWSKWEKGVTSEHYFSVITEKIKTVVSELVPFPRSGAS